MVVGTISSVNGKTLLDAFNAIGNLKAAVVELVKAVEILNNEVEQQRQEVDLLIKWQKNQYVKNRKTPGS